MPLFGISGFVLVLALFFRGDAQELDEKISRLLENGATCNAVVVDVEKGRRHNYFLVAEYSVNQKKYVAYIRTKEEIYERKDAAIGDIHSIVYWIPDPSIYEADTNEQELESMRKQSKLSFPAWLIPVSFVLACLGLLLEAIAWMRTLAGR
ncbi:MAG: hypothetical protein L6Q71_03560 [Planctomycetes bacterium]|nr:hypothetical protein [Planctomycetota bacterium]NUQ33869.1 hypothetical protein [Planctomycetaceae bacterium]